MKEFSSIQNGQTRRLFVLEFVFFLLPLGNEKVVSCRINFIFVVKDWIIVISSEKGYRLITVYVCPQRKYYTPYGKIFFQILWGINVKATHNCSSGPVQKKMKRKENIMAYGRQKSLSQPDFPFSCSLKHRHIEIVTCKLLLLRDLNLTIFSIQVCLGDIFS